MAKKPAPGGNLQELKTQLKNKDLGRLYIFHGEEVFLLHHYVEQMKKQLLDALTESFNFHRMNSETFDLQTFADAVENLPMMAEHTMVQVDEVDLFKLGESDRNKMAEILADIPDYCTVVFTYETTPWKPDKRLKKLWEAIDGAGLLYGEYLADAFVTRADMLLRQQEVYRALAESTVFGARRIIERFREEGVPVKAVAAIGGIARKSPFVMQMCADVFNLPIKTPAAEQACALGGAMFAAAAAGVYPDLDTAMRKMGAGIDRVYEPDPAHAAVYEEEYRRYLAYGKLLEEETMKNV